MASGKWQPREDHLLARRQLSAYLLSKMKTGLRLDQAVSELILAINDASADSQIQTLAFASQRRHSTKFFVSADTVKRWFREAMPDAKARLRQYALELAAGGMSIEDVASVFGISVQTFKKWQKAGRQS